MDQQSLGSTDDGRTLKCVLLIGTMVAICFGPGLFNILMGWLHTPKQGQQQQQRQHLQHSQQKPGQESAVGQFLNPAAAAAERRRLAAMQAASETF